MPNLFAEGPLCFDVKVWSKVSLVRGMEESDTKSYSLPSSLQNESLIMYQSKKGV